MRPAWSSTGRASPTTPSAPDPARSTASGRGRRRTVRIRTRTGRRRGVVPECRASRHQVVNRCISGRSRCGRCRSSRRGTPATAIVCGPLGRIAQAGPQQWWSGHDALLRPTPRGPKTAAGSRPAFPMTGKWRGWRHTLEGGVRSAAFVELVHREAQLAGSTNRPSPPLPWATVGGSGC